MIELNEKASNYTEENVLNVLKEAFAKVYADGYRMGYKDREDETPVELRDGKTEFVDLGLPSGTLWAKEYGMTNKHLDYEAYLEALKFDIPTIDQCVELFNLCRFKQDGDTIYCIGPNGKSITFSYTGYKEIGKEEAPVMKYISYFWIKNEDKEPDHNAASLGNSFNGIWKVTTQVFPGYKLPIRLVRKK